jgi:hypothetical protein
VRLRHIVLFIFLIVPLLLGSSQACAPAAAGHPITTGDLSQITNPVMTDPPQGFPQNQLDIAGIKNYSRVLTTVADYYEEYPSALRNSTLVITRVVMRTGVNRTLIFTSRAGMPYQLEQEMSALEVRVWKLLGCQHCLPGEASHAETTAITYREEMGDFPADQQIAQVEDVFSTVRVCGETCGANLTGFLDRAGVAIEPGTYGYIEGQLVTQARIAQLRLTGSGPAVRVVARAYSEYADGAADPGDEENP